MICPELTLPLKAAVTKPEDHLGARLFQPSTGVSAIRYSPTEVLVTPRLSDLHNLAHTSD